MKWFTCIIHMRRHIAPVQTFHTRAETVTQAVINAHKWILDGEPKWTAADIDIPFVFEGRMSDMGGVDWDEVNAAIGWVDPNDPRSNPKLADQKEKVR